MEPKKNQNQQKETQWMGAGLIAAFTASLCCITPVVGFLAGIGGIATTFSWIEPFRPYLIGFTALLLGFAWYQKLKPRKEIECACEEKPSFWQTKKFLGIITVLAVVLMTFPYYSDAFFPKPEKKVVYVAKDQVKAVTFDVEGMTCTSCEETVKGAAYTVEGVMEAEASYKTGKTTIKYDGSRADIDKIAAAINKTGFKVKSHQLSGKY